MTNEGLKIKFFFLGQSEEWKNKITLFQVSSLNLAQ